MIFQFLVGPIIMNIENIDQIVKKALHFRRERVELSSANMIFNKFLTSLYYLTTKFNFEVSDNERYDYVVFYLVKRLPMKAPVHNNFVASHRTNKYDKTRLDLDKNYVRVSCIT